MEQHQNGTYFPDIAWIYQSIFGETLFGRFILPPLGEVGREATTGETISDRTIRLPLQTSNKLSTSSPLCCDIVLQVRSFAHLPRCLAFYLVLGHFITLEEIICVGLEEIRIR